ncbi:hypothetical protein ABZS81_23110 [Streptomyces sp. NPDC005318]|uniref:hypothetical protein n=1 Tax=Streptomyces sp. NPDC005318 TaxID=3157031 RepID=UPI0033AA739C
MIHSDARGEFAYRQESWADRPLGRLGMRRAIGARDHRVSFTRYAARRTGLGVPPSGLRQHPSNLHQFVLAMTGVFPPDRGDRSLGLVVSVLAGAEHGKIDAVTPLAVPDFRAVGVQRRTVGWWIVGLGATVL